MPATQRNNFGPSLEYLCILHYVLEHNIDISTDVVLRINFITLPMGILLVKPSLISAYHVNSLPIVV